MHGEGPSRAVLCHWLHAISSSQTLVKALQLGNFGGRWNGDPHVLDRWCVIQEILLKKGPNKSDANFGNRFLKDDLRRPHQHQQFETYCIAVVVCGHYLMGEVSDNPCRDSSNFQPLNVFAKFAEQQFQSSQHRMQRDNSARKQCNKPFDDDKQHASIFLQEHVIRAKEIRFCKMYMPSRKAKTVLLLRSIRTMEIPIVCITSYSKKVVKHLLYRLSPHHACRIGEAENPGPSDIPYKIGLINPTSIYNKQDEIQSLQCHTYTLSENSATVSVQKEMEQRFRSLGIKSTWSPPVAPHLACTFDTAKRGQASGVSIHSHFPMTPVEMQLGETIDNTRITSTVVHIGPWHIHHCVLYGVPSCHARSKEVTEQLLYQAGLQAAKLKLPTVISGDFNHSPQTLRTMTILADQGYRTTSDLYERLHGTQMPSTCRESTCNDQMIIHPALIPYLDHIQVDKSKMFSDHDPVICTFQLPGDLPDTQTIKHPATWTTYDPNPEYVAIAFEYYAKKKGLPISSEDQLSCDTLTDALVQWTTLVENSVDWAIRQQHSDDPKKFPAPMLPKNCKGRAKQKKIVHKPAFSWMKNACQGQFNLQHPATSIRLTQKVRQVRRIQSLYYRMTKLQQIENYFASHHTQLQGEWKAILQAPGYHPNFPSWCANIPEIGWCPLHVPQPEFLHLISQFAKFDCDQIAVKVAATTKKIAKFDALYATHQTIYAKTSKKVKKTSPDVLQEIRELVEIPAQLRQNHNGLFTLTVESTCLLQKHLPITFAGKDATINDMTNNTVDLYFNDADDDIPEDGKLTQQQCHTVPEVMAAKLDEYWGQYWCRDSNNDCNPQPHNDPWSSFQQWLDSTPQVPQATVALDDYRQWEQAIKQMNPKTARGIDSWTVDELRSLPTPAIKSLSQIFHRFQGHPFPKRWLVAITIPLGKEIGAHLPAKTRPITVLSLLYRLWSKVVTTQILKHWTQHLPGYIVGFIPGRSPQNEMVKIQHEFEVSHTNFEIGATQWQGITLDLVKCFNLIPREPARRALLKAGVPEVMIRVWFDSLMQLVRYWKFGTSITESGLTTTGTPEGDTFSVLCCVAISRIWAHHLSVNRVIPSCYADNWSWRSKTLESNLLALEATKDFTTVCRLRIDWTKTWAWITYHNNKAAWKSAMRQALPRAATLHVVTSARELGYTMHYSKTQSRATQKQRHREALEQVLKIRKMPVPLQVKAQLLTDACLSKALSHTETYHVGAPWFKELRAAMSRTLVPDRKITNPYLSVMLLSKYTIDPELYYIRQCIRTIRRFLTQADEDTTRQFLEIAAKHNLKPMQVHGPAGTLATSLIKLGWKVTVTGQIHTDTSLNLHLLQSPLASIMHCTIHAWMKNVSQIHLTRQAWRNLPVINRQDTVKIFMQLPQSQQNVVARFLTGSYMEPKQKEHVRDGPVFCEICNQDEDSLHHRLLECCHTEYVRQEYPLVTQFLESHDTCHLQLPIVYQDDHYDFNTWFFHQNWESEVNDQVLQQIKLENQQGIRSKIYSDGTCRNPTSPTFRRAAYALVFHHEIPLQRCQELVREYWITKNLPDSFQVLSTGQCTDFQSITRAELSAAMVLLQQKVVTTLFTDSQYVVDVCEKMGHILDAAHMQAWPNFDVLLQMWNNLQQGTTTIVKIKSHAISEDDSHIETMNKLGNEAADTAARETLKHLDMVTPMHKNYTEHKEYLDMVQQQMQYRYHIQVARAKCLQQKDTQNQPQMYLSYQTQQDRLMQWKWDDGRKYDFDDNDFEQLQNNLWGTTISHRILTWLTTLTWPTQLSDAQTTGITWYELAVNFQTVMQCGLLINAGHTGNQFLPRRLAIGSHEWPYSKQVAAFERVITTMQKLLRKDILPLRRQMSNTLRLLGATHGKQGLKDRPQMMYQKETLQTILSHFRKNRGITADEPPDIVTLSPYCNMDDHWSDKRDQGQWTQRISRYHVARKRR